MMINRKIHLLLIEDEEYDVRRIRNTIRPFADRIIIEDVVANGYRALELLKKNPRRYDVVIMDFQIAGGLSGEKLIRAMKEIEPTIQIMVVTKMTVNISDFEFANRLIEAGAMWYCTKYPGDIEEYIYQPTDFILTIFNAYEKKQLEKEKLRTHKKMNENVRDILREKKIVGDSEPIRKLRELIQKAAETDSTVLIQGASGTGKELVAANIHYHSQRRFERFIAINCGGLPSELVESELFGFEKGAFTGAHAGKPGLLEVAHRGTAFLDEIADLPLSAQAKMLRFLQEGEIDKIGRTEKLKVDVRVIAASNRNLREAVQNGSFREDLFYRLNVFTIHVPSLQERPEDIPLLVEHFLEKFSNQMSREKPQITEGALQLLREHPWPGNVRELENVVQRLLFTGSRLLSEEDVRVALGSAIPSQTQISTDNILQWDARNILPWREMERELRRKYFQFVREHSESDAEAARKLGLAPPNFHRMLKELGMK